MYLANSERYDSFQYRKIKNSGLVLPPLSLGCWHNFGDDTPIQQQKSVLYTAFDHGINHFDLANNYGTPFGSAEKNIGHFLKTDFKPYRDELIISTKAGWDMWPGPYGQGGSSRKYLMASLDQSLQRLGLDYVDIFIHIAMTLKHHLKKQPRHLPILCSKVKHSMWGFLLDIHQN